MRIMEIFHLDDMTPGQRAEVLALRTESRMRRLALPVTGGWCRAPGWNAWDKAPGGDPKAYLIRGRRWRSAARTPWVRNNVGGR